MVITYSHEIIARDWEKVFGEVVYKDQGKTSKEKEITEG